MGMKLLRYKIKEWKKLKKPKLKSKVICRYYFQNYQIKYKNFTTVFDRAR